MEQKKIKTRTTLRVRCSEDVKRAYKKYAADYKNYEEALIALLRQAEAYPPKGVVY